MPVSNYTNIGPIMNKIRSIHAQSPIKSVLDIGIGFGKYGFLLREFLDIRVGRYDKVSWQTRIDGVEIWPAYVNELHRYIYDRVYIGDIMKLSFSQLYDLVIMSEIIEHLNKIEGLKLLNSLSFNTALIITTPQHFVASSGNWENPYEKHLCLWKVDDLRLIFPNLESLTKTAFLVS
jgi:hypothetical protein